MAAVMMLDRRVDLAGIIAVEWTELDPCLDVCPRLGKGAQSSPPHPDMQNPLNAPLLCPLTSPIRALPHATASPACTQPVMDASFSPAPGVCFCCSLCLECSLPWSWLGCPFSSFKQLFTYHLPREGFPDHPQPILVPCIHRTSF